MSVSQVRCRGISQVRSRGVQLLLVHVFWPAIAIDRLDRRQSPLQCRHGDDGDKPAGQLLDWSIGNQCRRLVSVRR